MEEGKWNTSNQCLLAYKNYQCLFVPIYIDSSTLFLPTGRSSHVSYVNDPPERKRMLPSWCLYVAYILCFLLSTLSILMVILYGYNFGKLLALKWLLAFSVTLMGSALILDPVLVCDNNWKVLLATLQLVNTSNYTFHNLTDKMQLIETNEVLAFSKKELVCICTLK